MSYRMLIVTDHTTHVASNSVYELAIALQADRRADKVWVCSRGLEQNKAFFEGHADATVLAAPVESSFIYASNPVYFHSKSAPLSLADIDVILLRMPQPLSKPFLLSLSEKLPKGVIINDPEGTIRTSSKEFLLTIPHLCPTMQMCYTTLDAIDLSGQYEIVLKPMYSYGGHDIARLSTRYFWMGVDRYPAAKIHDLMPAEMFPMLAMRYLPNVTIGDKRTIVVNRQILGSALRIPPPDSWICNIAQGGHALIAEADEQELRIEAELTPLLYDHGILMYGFDTLVDDVGIRVLSEINTLSIGGLDPMEKMSGRPLLKHTAALIWDHVEESIN